MSRALVRGGGEPAALSTGLAANWGSDAVFEGVMVEDTAEGVSVQLEGTHVDARDVFLRDISAIGLYATEGVDALFSRVYQHRVAGAVAAYPGRAILIEDLWVVGVQEVRASPFALPVNAVAVIGLADLRRSRLDDVRRGNVGLDVRGAVMVRDLAIHGAEGRAEASGVFAQVESFEGSRIEITNMPFGIVLFGAGPEPEGVRLEDARLEVPSFPDALTGVLYSIDFDTVAIDRLAAHPYGNFGVLVTGESGQAVLRDIRLEGGTDLAVGPEEAKGILHGIGTSGMETTIQRAAVVDPIGTGVAVLAGSGLVEDLHVSGTHPSSWTGSGPVALSTYTIGFTPPPLELRRVEFRDNANIGLQALGVTVRGSDVRVEGTHCLDDECSLAACGLTARFAGVFELERFAIRDNEVCGAAVETGTFLVRDNERLGRVYDGAYLQLRDGTIAGHPIAIGVQGEFQEEFLDVSSSVQLSDNVRRLDATSLPVPNLTPIPNLPVVP